MPASLWDAGIRFCGCSFAIFPCESRGFFVFLLFDAEILDVLQGVCCHWKFCFFSQPLLNFEF
jgi:hypothetical protein